MFSRVTGRLRPPVTLSPRSIRAARSRAATARSECSAAAARLAVIAAFRHGLDLLVTLCNVGVPGGKHCMEFLVGSRILKLQLTLLVRRHHRHALMQLAYDLGHVRAYAVGHSIKPHMRICPEVNPIGDRRLKRDRAQGGEMLSFHLAGHAACRFQIGLQAVGDASKADKHVADRLRRGCESRIRYSDSASTPPAVLAHSILCCALGVCATRHRQEPRRPGPRQLGVQVRGGQRTNTLSEHRGRLLKPPSFELRDKRS
jgi:hypothetical protein